MLFAFSDKYDISALPYSSLFDECIQVLMTAATICYKIKCVYVPVLHIGMRDFLRILVSTIAITDSFELILDSFFRLS